MKKKFFFIRVKEEGFTLLEILITIALISTISIPIFGNFIKTQERARDAVRRHDLAEISNALEQYYAICGFRYPDGFVPTAGGSVTCITPSIAIMPKIPKDPKGTGSYAYTCNGCTTTTYQLCARLEADIAPAPTGFCLVNRQ